MGRNLTVLEMQQQCWADSGKWFPETQKALPVHAMAMGGEAGEVLQLVVRMEKGIIEWNDERRLQLAMELADVFTYLLNCAMIIGIDLEKAYLEKRRINAERFGAVDGDAGAVGNGIRGAVWEETRGRPDAVRSDSLPESRPDEDDGGGVGGRSQLRIVHLPEVPSDDGGSAE